MVKFSSLLVKFVVKIPSWRVKFVVKIPSWGVKFVVKFSSLLVKFVVKIRGEDPFLGVAGRKWSHAGLNRGLYGY